MRRIIASAVMCLGLLAGTLALTAPAASATSPQYCSSGSGVHFCYRIYGTGTFVDFFSVSQVQNQNHYPPICVNAQITGPNGWSSGVHVFGSNGGPCNMYPGQYAADWNDHIAGYMTPGSYCASVWLDWAWVGGHCWDVH